jgi:hypothetical protein
MTMARPFNKTIALLGTNAIIVVAAAWFAWLSLFNSDSPQLASSSAVAPVAATAIAVAIPDASPLTSAPIFSSSRSPISPPASIPKHVDSSPPPHLVGLSIDSAGNSYAVLEDANTQKSRMVTVNEEFNGWRIVGIHSDSVVILPINRPDNAAQEPSRLFLYPQKNK